MKIGDKVTLKDGLKIGVKYGSHGGITLLEPMYNKASGKECIVEWIDSAGIAGLKGIDFSYDIEMLRPVGFWTDELEAEKELDELLKKYRGVARCVRRR